MLLFGTAFVLYFFKCDVLLDLVPFVQFKKREIHPWRSVTFSTKSNTPPWVFFTCFKLFKWYQIAQNITNVQLSLNVEVLLEQHVNTTKI